MRTCTRRSAGSVLLLLAFAGWSTGSVLATDDYTLPFYDPGVTLSYGVDRDRRLNRQLDWTGQVWNDGAVHPGRVYDQHSGVDYPMALRSEVAAAKDGVLIDVEAASAPANSASSATSSCSHMPMDGAPSTTTWPAPPTAESGLPSGPRWSRASRSGARAAAGTASAPICISRC